MPQFNQAFGRPIQPQQMPGRPPMQQMPQQPMGGMPGGNMGPQPMQQMPTAAQNNMGMQRLGDFMRGGGQMGNRNLGGPDQMNQLLAGAGNNPLSGQMQQMGGGAHFGNAGPMPQMQAQQFSPQMMNILQARMGGGGGMGGAMPNFGAQTGGNMAGRMGNPMQFTPGKGWSPGSAPAGMSVPTQYNQGF
jgi:hypothetical protein